MVYENLIGKHIRFAQNTANGKLFWRDGILIEADQTVLLVEIAGQRKVYPGVVVVEEYPKTGVSGA